MSHNTMSDSISVKEIFDKKITIGERVQFKSKSLSQEQINQISESSEYKLNRIFDLFIGSFALLSFAILFPIISLSIKISSKGPVLFKQKRTGKNGIEFDCIKFRTMHIVDLKSESGKPVVTQKGDIRIFRFGQILRKTNLDELPQVLNVIKGEMSLVGPRPYPVEECKHWNNTYEDFFYRYLVRPGITGYAQVTGYRGGTLDEEHMRRRLNKDLIYVQKQNLLFDIKIIYLTVKQMITFKTNAH